VTTVDMNPFLYSGMGGPQMFMPSVPLNVNALGAISTPTTSLLPSFDMNALAAPVITGDTKSSSTNFPTLNLGSGSTLPTISNLNNQMQNMASGTLPFLGISQSFLMLQSQVNTMISSVLVGLPELLASIMSDPQNFLSAGMNGMMGTGGTSLNGVEARPGNTQDAIKFFESKGWTHAQAVGIVANLIKESNLKTNAVGDGGQAYGIAQWHPGRQANFAKYARENGLSNTDIRKATFTEQLGFVDWELRNTESNAGNKLRQATTAYDAAAAFCRYYERPANVDARAAERGRLAQQLA
jgi:hypothetical protein